MSKRSPFRYFKTGPEIIRLAVMLYVPFPLSLRNIEDLLHERGVEVSHETVRYGSGGCEVCRSSHPSTPLSAAISTWTAGTPLA